MKPLCFQSYCASRLSGLIVSRLKGYKDLSETLKDLRSRISAIGLVDLISINVSIQQAYGYVHFLEAKIAGEYSMDSVIKSYAN